MGFSAPTPDIPAPTAPVAPQNQVNINTKRDMLQNKMRRHSMTQTIYSGAFQPVQNMQKMLQGQDKLGG